MSTLYSMINKNIPQLISQLFIFIILLLSINEMIFLDRCALKNDEWLNNKHIGPVISIIKRSQTSYLNHKLQDYNLGNGQAFILRKLYSCGQNNKINQEFFVKHFQIDKAAIARSIKKLEERKYIERRIDPDNRRQYLISLTSKGKKIAEDIKRYEEEWENYIYDNYPHEKEDLLNNLKEMATLSLKLIEKQEGKNE